MENTENKANWLLCKLANLEDEESFSIRFGKAEKGQVEE